MKAANADTQAAIDDRHGIALAAIAELAQDYLQLHGAQAELAIAGRNLGLAEQNVGLVRLQAWQEMDDALTAYAEAQRRRVQAADAVAQNGRSRTQPARRGRDRSC